MFINVVSIEKYNNQQERNKKKKWKRNKYSISKNDKIQTFHNSSDGFKKINRTTHSTINGSNLRILFNSIRSHSYLNKNHIFSF